MNDDLPPQKRKWGFQNMDPDAQRQLASQGGKAAHALGRAHKFTTEEAKAAGKKSAAARMAKKAMP